MRIIRKIEIFGQMEDKSTWNETKIVAKVLLEHLTQEGNRSVLEVIIKLIQEGAEEQRKDARQEKLTKFKHNLIGRAQGGGRELHRHHGEVKQKILATAGQDATFEPRVKEQVGGWERYLQVG